jgi:hypothetical protein
MANTKNMTPKELANSLNVDPKALRRYLRSNHSRDAKAKGTSWTLDARTVTAARKHFAKAKKAA